jgi:hypothetical protein
MVLWDMTPFSLVDSYLRSCGNYCFQLQKSKPSVEERGTYIERMSAGTVRL